MITYATIQAAIQAWVVAGSGLAASNVVFAGQNSPRPSGDYISIRMGGPSRIGIDWQKTRDVDSPEEGKEIERQARGSRRLTVQIQAFGGAIGATAAAARLAGVVDKAGHYSQLDAFKAAGLGLGFLGDIQTIDGVVGGSTFEPRALLEARFHAIAESSEFLTYVESVELTTEIADGDQETTTIEVTP